jgi:hypothetical protein
MPGILQSDSLSTGLPIENSPPGIQTIPAGAAGDTGAVFGIVGAKDEAITVTGSFDIGGKAAGEDDGFIAWTAKAAAVTTPNTTSQPARTLFFDFFFARNRFPPGRIELPLETEDLFPVVLHADHSPAVLLRFVVQRLGESTHLRIR